MPPKKKTGPKTKKLTKAQLIAQKKKSAKAKKGKSAVSKGKKKPVSKKKRGAGEFAGTTIWIDEKIVAKPRGKRKSKNGNTYYEYRVNMSDSKNKGDKYQGMV